MVQWVEQRAATRRLSARGLKQISQGYNRKVLKHQVLEVRKALGDDPRNPRFIEAMPRRGYRFIAPVSAGAETHRTGEAGSRPLGGFLSASSAATSTCGFSVKRASWHVARSNIQDGNSRLRPSSTSSGTHRQIVPPGLSQIARTRMRLPYQGCHW